jgi:hypothetical protein
METTAQTFGAAERRSFPRRALDRVTGQSTVAVVPGTDGVRVSWGGIWGGVLVALAVLVLLTSLGLAVGVSAVNPNDTDAAESVGIGAAIWSAVSLLLALYVAGMVATRIGATHDKSTSLFEGVLVWIVSVLLIAYMAGAGISLVATGAFKMIGGATQAIGAIATNGAPDLAQGNVDQIVQRLRDARTAQVLASATGMQEEDVRKQLAQIADKADAARSNPAQVAADVRESVRNMIDKARNEGRLAQAAERAKPGATKAAWVTFGALVLSLLAAVFGALSGRRDPIVRTGQIRTA